MGPLPLPCPAPRLPTVRNCRRGCPATGTHGGTRQPCEGLLPQAASQYERGTFDQKMRQHEELACLFQDDTNNMLAVVVIVDEGNNKATMLQMVKGQRLAQNERWTRLAH